MSLREGSPEGKQKPRRDAAVVFMLVGGMVIISWVAFSGLYQNKGTTDHVPLISHQSAGRELFCLLEHAQLRSQPMASDTGGRIEFGESVVVCRTQGDWVFARATESGEEGWICRFALADSDNLINAVRAKRLIPNSLLLLRSIKGPRDFSCEVVEGGLWLRPSEDDTDASPSDPGYLRVGGKPTLLPGNCLVCPEGVPSGYAEQFSPFGLPMPLPSQDVLYIVTPENEIVALADFLEGTRWHVLAGAISVVTLLAGTILIYSRRSKHLRTGGVHDE